MNNEKKKKRRMKLKKKNVIILSIVTLLLLALIFYISSINISQIQISGTTLISDTEVIEAAKIKDYPKLFSVSSSTIANRVKTLDLVSNCKVRKNLYGKVTIEIDEAKVLFYNKANNKVVLSNEKEAENKNYLGIPTLLNYVPSDIYSSLIKGLSLVDTNIINIISEIEYSPTKTSTGEIIDNERFLFKMNDSNTVQVNIVNIKKLNKYLEIIASSISQSSEKYGILYLDSANDATLFKSYEAIEKEAAELAKKEAEANEGTEN